MCKALVYGNNINTDLIVAGKYTKTLNFEELASHCMEDLDPAFHSRLEKGDVLVVGENFGCGSSREQAPVALKYAGIGAILAKSYARIFYRNAINVGLPVLVCNTDGIKDGDTVHVDIEKDEVIVNEKRKILCQAISPIMKNILKSGGLTSFLKEKGDFVL